MLEPNQLLFLKLYSDELSVWKKKIDMYILLEQSLQEKENLNNK